MVLSYAYCNVSIAPLHTEPAHRAEQSSQLLFGERVEILEIDNNDWARIRGRWDGYEGWVKASQLQIIYAKDYKKPVRQVCARQTDKLIADDGEIWLPAGSELAGIKNAQLFHGSKHGKFKGKKINLEKIETTPALVIEAARSYLHAPYLWGAEQ